MSIRNRFRGTLPVAQWLTGGSGAVIQSVQRGTITVTAGNATNTATISSVDTNRTRLRWLGNSTDDTGAGGTGSGPTIATVTLTDATTVTATRTGTDNTVTVAFEVIEYKTGVVRSIQRGTVTIANTASSGTATLSPAVADLAKTTLDLLGLRGSVSYAPANFQARAVLTDGSTVTLTRSGTAGSLVGGYQVIEWN